MGKRAGFTISLIDTRLKLLKRTFPYTNTMKTKKTTAFAAIIGVTMALISPLAFAQGKGNSGSAPGQIKKLPIIPVGWIDAYPTIVQTGTHPTIRWGVNVPALVEDVIDIVNDDTVVAKEELCVECRVLGNGVTVHWPNGHWEFVPAEALISFNGGSFEQVFYGTNHDVDPGEIVWRKSEVQANQTIRFGGRYHWRNNWGPLYKSSAATQNVRVLTHGQTPPDHTPMHADVPSIEDFIKPYLDEYGRINIGPMDVIVLMELTHDDSQHGHHGYDLQDMVMLCTMKPKLKTTEISGDGTSDGTSGGTTSSGKSGNRSGLADGTNPGKGNQMGRNDGTENPNNAPHSGGSD